jgi:eukaryotic-like serine/threonine-protein kinase
MPDAPTLIAGRYRLGDLLGHGGMGRVWRARDETLERDVAIKEIDVPPDLLGADREAVQRRTLREARAAARLNHPGVVQVYDVLELDGRTWIVMEYVPSRTLQEVLAAEGPLEPREVARIGLDLLLALRAANAAGVDHRDVKPANVLLADDGRVMLTDFGIATIEGDSLITSGFDTLIGSPGYLSPERAGHGTAGLASDLWSLGATLYAAVEGRPPFHRPSTIATLTALATDEPDPPLRAGALRPVLDALLRKDPDERAGSDEVENLLVTAMVKTDPVRAAPAHVPAQRQPSDPLVPAPPAVPARRRRLLVAAVVLAVMLGAVGWLIVRTTADRPAADPTPSAAPSVAPSTAPSVAPSTAPPTEAPSPSPTVKPPPTKATPVSGRPAVPAGWHDYHDPTGFSIYVPDGWTRSQEGTIVYFRGDGRVLGIDQSDHPKSDPVADWRGQRDYRVARGDFPAYRELRLVAVPYFRKAADWEFTYTRGGRRHVNNRGFVVSAAQAYGIYWQTADADWAAARPDLALVFASFRPANG